MFPAPIKHSSQQVPDLGDAANSLTVVTIQLGIALGAGYGALALNTAGALLVPLAAAIPIAAALAIILVSHNGYAAGPREKRPSPM